MAVLEGPVLDVCVLVEAVKVVVVLVVGRVAVFQVEVVVVVAGCDLVVVVPLSGSEELEVIGDVGVAVVALEGERVCRVAVARAVVVVMGRARRGEVEGMSDSCTWVGMVWAGWLAVAVQAAHGSCTL